MNNEIKKEWVTALRSGNYKQGKSHLRNLDDSYCCAGVLCDILVRKGSGEWKRDSSESYYTYEGSGYSLTGEVLEKVEILGMKQDLMCDMNGSRGRHSIYYMNDNLDLNFSEIADIIEEQL